MRFFERQISEQIIEELKERLWLYERDASKRVERILGNAVAVYNDSVTVGPGQEHVILDVTSERYEMVEGAFNLSGLKAGDQLRLDIFLRWPGGELVKWQSPSAMGKLDNPALALEPLFCPAGARIVAKHVAGGAFPLHYFLIRRR